MDECNLVMLIDRRITVMNDHHPWDFTCKTCGSHKLTVTRVWKILAGPDSEIWQEWGPLEADHLWRFEFKEKIEKEKYKDDEVERRDFGEYTKDDSSSKPEEYEIFEKESDPEGDEFYVNCAGCVSCCQFPSSRTLVMRWPGYGAAADRARRAWASRWQWPQQAAR